jgi:hypothetical protein
MVLSVLEVCLKRVTTLTDVYSVNVYEVSSVCQALWYTLQIQCREQNNLIGLCSLEQRVSGDIQPHVTE